MAHLQTYRPGHDEVCCQCGGPIYAGEDGFYDTTTEKLYCSHRCAKEGQVGELFDIGARPNDIIRVKRSAGAVLASLEHADGATIMMPYLGRHSPTGFEYGYAGSGPAELSLSILAVCIGLSKAEALYHQFKFERIAPETSDVWTMKVETVREWADQARKARNP